MKLSEGMPCPVCVKEGKVVPREKWTHGDHCGGDMFLENNGIIYCSKCGCGAPALGLRYTCSNGHTYSYSTVEGLANAIALSGSIDNKYRIRWLREFIEECK